jgi:hypothetical protein
MHIASEMSHPQVVGFLGCMLRGKDPTVRVEVVTLAAGSWLGRQTLPQAGLRERSWHMPIAVKPAQGEEFSQPRAGEGAYRRWRLGADSLVQRALRGGWPIKKGQVRSGACGRE